MEEASLIATRAYYLKGEEGRTAEMLVSVSRPYLLQPGFYRCEFHAKTRTRDWAAHTDGIDELDALISALCGLGSYVAIMNEQNYQGQLRWEGDPTGADLGLPTVEHHWPFRKDRKLGDRPSR